MEGDGEGGAKAPPLGNKAPGFRRFACSATGFAFCVSRNFAARPFGRHGRPWPLRVLTKYPIDESDGRIRRDEINQCNGVIVPCSKVMPVAQRFVLF